MRGRAGRILLGASLLVVVGALMTVAAVTRGAAGAAAAEREAAQKRLQELAQGGNFADLFPAVADYVLPSVVAISTTQKVRRPELYFELPDPFRRFFRPFDPFGWGPDEREDEPSERERDRRRRERILPREREFEQHGLGSGFVIDPRGYIVTNNHVVRGIEAKDITITFLNGGSYVAKEVRRDPNTELAVIKVDGDGFPALSWGDSEKLRIGEWVMAIGNPMGFGHTVTAGIISAKTTEGRVFEGGKPRGVRVIDSPFAIEDYIQTDAAINPGNSGGPLVNLRGEVVGINTFIVSTTGASAGLGFAVPSRLANRVVTTLIEKGKVERGYLGIQFIDPDDLDDQAAWQFFDERNADKVLDKYHIKKTDKGVIVADVLPGTPAAKAGLEKGDLIVAFQGEPITEGKVFRLKVAETKPGTEVTLKVLRKGREREVKVTLAAQPSEVPAVALIGKGTYRSEDLGLSVQEINPAIARALGYEEDLKGLVVTHVEPGKPAAKAGVQRNDVILQVNRQDTTDVATFARTLEAIGNRELALLIRRGEMQEFVTIPARR